ncbi:hypothetical protein CISG_06899 [Coccidioides immitis RMSCC 3703]|uniref:Sister chromatid cohesion protein pds5 n=1 Tax=Coccidioides immitis RMSCC 3703 TaxID=454286 RepID=A0A0J8R0Y8_COCIT|nr:hypothetical protein CISG_06899 [Coccidioides immitis RMSCC 3703]
MRTLCEPSIYQSPRGIINTFPDSSLVSADLWKFAKMHDRRSYQLIRFAMAATSDYRTVTKAIRELTSRIQSNTSATSSMLGNLLPLVYRSSSLIFNRSHVPATMKISRTDELGLGNIAHEMLREISSHNPEVLEAHVQEMCKDLESHAPTANLPDDPGVEEILKACAGFAKKLPNKLPKERKFLAALSNYALYSSYPHAAKNAVTILMAAAETKEMYARDLIKKSIHGCSYGAEHFLTKLATISQLNLLVPREVDEEGDTVLDIATKQILLANLNPEPDSEYAWSATMDERQISEEDESHFREYAQPVYTILNTLIANWGELSKARDTPASQKSRLRLLAAKSVLKLCAARPLCDRMLTAAHFNSLALVAMDPLLELKKKLVQPPHLSPRWYAITFLLAFEPVTSLYDSTLTWLRSRTAFFSRQVQGKSPEQQTLMESLFARLLSLLAHHPDYPPEDSDESTKAKDLLDFTRYILFYLTAVANENNLSLIFHIAQRVKQTRDAISETESHVISTRLHTLSDLSQATIRRFAEKVDERLDKKVRDFMRPKTHAGRKRKVELGHGDKSRDEAMGSAKKPRREKSSRRKSSSGTAGTKPTKRRKADEDDWESDGGETRKKYSGSSSSAARRRSGRGLTKTDINYAEEDSDEADKEMEKWNTSHGRKEKVENNHDSPDSDDEEQLSELSSNNSDKGTPPSDEEPDEDADMSGVEKSSTPPPQARRSSRSKISLSPVVPKAGRGRPPKSRPKEVEEKSAKKKTAGGRVTRRGR